MHAWLRNAKFCALAVGSMTFTSPRPGDPPIKRALRQRRVSQSLDYLSSLLPLDLDDSDELNVTVAKLEKLIFDCSLSLKKLLKNRTTETSVSDSKGVKLPKLDVPTFNGDILNRRSFWEQFCMSVHNPTTLSTSEKLVYLQHALKDSSAKHIIEGLSRSGEYYDEAVDCLKSRYDRPRLIHQTHV